MTIDESTGRFMRPIQVGTTNRSRRRVQFRRVLLIAVNLILVSGVLVGSAWVYQRTQQDERFAIRMIVTNGTVHAPSERIDAILERYRGANLFRLDIDTLEMELDSVPWVERVSIEKQLPDTLRLSFLERVPAAVVRSEDGDRFIDAKGVIFAPFDPTVSDRAFPVITESDPESAAVCVSFLESLRRSSPDLYVRVSEIQEAPSVGWIVRDALLGAPVYVSEKQLSQKWRTLTDLAAAEDLDGQGIEYADLRFERQIVVKRMHHSETQGEIQHAEN